MREVSEQEKGWTVRRGIGSVVRTRRPITMWYVLHDGVTIASFTNYPAARDYMLRRKGEKRHDPRTVAEG